MTALTSLGLFVLSVPLAWELWNDRKGDYNKGRGVIIRCLLFIVCALVVHYLTKHKLIVTFNLAAAIHFMFFDYAINYILYRNKIIASPYWFSYTGKSGVIDNIKGWKHLNPWLKLIIRVLYLSVALFLYIKL